MLTALIAILVPGLPLADQPYLPPTEPAEVWHVHEGVQSPSGPLIGPGPARSYPDDPSGAQIGSQPAYVVPEPWATLADCESGDWIDGGRAFVAGSARWDWAAPGTTLPPWGTRIHHGGLQFHPATWDWVAPDVLEDPPAHAYDATPAEQVAVAIETQRRQGWEAWPVCSRKVGLR